MPRLRLLVAAAVVAIQIAPGLAGPVAAETTMVMADSYNFKFDPSTVTIPVGDSVMWMNIAGHTVTSSSPNWSVNATSDTTYTFSLPGRYTYYCQVHGPLVMSGQVVVTGPLLAVLSGADQVPPVASAGTGSVRLTLDAAAGTVAGSWSVTGLTSSIIAAHIHRGAAGVNGPIVVMFSDVPAAGGTFSTSNRGVDPALIREIQADPAGFYVNVHTVNNGGGEIRGQLSGTRKLYLPLTPRGAVVA